MIYLVTLTGHNGKVASAGTKDNNAKMDFQEMMQQAEINNH